MAENNRNWQNQSHQDMNRSNDQDQRWDNDRDRNRENDGSFGNTGYGSNNSDYGNNQGSSWNQGNYGNRGNMDQNRWQNTGGNQWNRDNDWDRHRGSSGYQSNHDDWNRRNMNSDWGSNYGAGMGSGMSYGMGASTGGHYGHRASDWGNTHGSWGNTSNREGWDRNSDMRSNSGHNYGNNYRGKLGWENRMNFNDNANDGNRDWWERTKDEVSSWFGDDDAERRRRIDRMNSGDQYSNDRRTFMGGGFKGKGPKDYRRSEDRIREDVCDRLSDDDMLDATNVQVQIEGNDVVLTGTVETREQKRRAEDIVESISGVQNVENRIRVSQRPERIP